MLTKLIHSAALRNIQCPFGELEVYDVGFHECLTPDQKNLLVQGQYIVESDGGIPPIGGGDYSGHDNGARVVLQGHGHRPLQPPLTQSMAANRDGWA